MICTKSRVEISQMHEAVNQQSRADQQDERDRYFANNEQTANAIALCASDGIAAAFLERLVKTEIGRLRGWREPKDQSRHDRREQRVGRSRSKIASLGGPGLPRVPGAARSPFVARPLARAKDWRHS